MCMSDCFHVCGYFICFIIRAITLQSYGAHANCAHQAAVRKSNIDNKENRRNFTGGSVIPPKNRHICPILFQAKTPNFK